jgi:hypothetical protein
MDRLMELIRPSIDKTAVTGAEENELNCKSRCNTLEEENELNCKSRCNTLEEENELSY